MLTFQVPEVLRQFSLMKFTLRTLSHVYYYLINNLMIFPQFNNS